jgi:hypothetical protein
LSNGVEPALARELIRSAVWRNSFAARSRLRACCSSRTSPTSSSSPAPSPTWRSSSMPSPARSSAGSRHQQGDPIRGARDPPSSCAAVTAGAPDRRRDTPLGRGLSIYGCALRRDAVAVRFAALDRVGRRRLRQRPGRGHHRLVRERVRPRRLTVRRGPLHTLSDVEIITADYVRWFNQQHLIHRLGRVSPAEAESRYYAKHVTDQPVGSQNPEGGRNPGRFSQTSSRDRRGVRFTH